MLNARIYQDEWAVVSRLNEVFGATRKEFINIVREVVGAMADAVDDDPDFTSGMFGHIHGVRNTRGTFRQKGWKRLTKNGNSLVKHPEIELLLGYQTVDLAASEDHEPKAISGKGSGAKKVIDEAQATLYSLLDLQTDQSPPPANTGLWHLCISVNGDDVRAEVSLSSGVTIDAGSKRGNFGQFIERIFIIEKGDWDDFNLTFDEDSDAVEFEPLVMRK
jgi:hypothetical protein